ncbi:MAG: Trk system potassium transporter TrkA [Gemmatimonadota bacterium]|jgi:trk system potassium uptake protein TrkA|nr:MAG: Trk system potassium transporter TrkA [Gemmatimonadota bacterium]
MRVLIVGAGQVGFQLAKRLSEEDQDVVLIDLDPDRTSYAAEQLDLLTVTGNGASLPVLEKAGLDGAGMLLAVTSRDESNIVACLLASRYAINPRVARISAPEYYEPGSPLAKELFGIDRVISPEREVAWETLQLLASEAATEFVRFMDERIRLIGVRIRAGAPVEGKTMADLGRELPDRRFVTVAIVRDGSTQIPRGPSRIAAHDQVFLLTAAEELPAIARLAGYERTELRRVMIAGGNQEAIYLAKHLASHSVSCTILERDRQRCLELAEQLPDALILHGDARDPELLEMEGVEGVDGFVAMTGQDSVNMLSGLLAKTMGARKVITLIHRTDYIPLVSRIGIDATVSPRMAAANAILRYVRRGGVRTVATLKGVNAEAIEYEIGADAPIIDQPLKDVSFPKDGVIGAILRGGEVITPRGDDVLKPGDRAFIFALPNAVADIERLLA